MLIRKALTDREKRQRARRARRMSRPKGKRNDLIAARELNRVTREIEPEIAEAFRDAIGALRSELSLRGLAEAIEDGTAPELVSEEEVVRRLRGAGVEGRSFFGRIVDAFRAGGEAGKKQLRDREVRKQTERESATFDMTNPEALRFLRNNVPEMISGIGRETQEAVRQTLLRGFEEGRTPIQMSREIRDIIGLTPSQAQAVQNLRRQLETGDMVGKRPGTRRLSAVEQAQAERLFSEARAGERPSRQQIDRIVDRYAESLRNRRAQNIARTETQRAFTEGQQELWRQAEQDGLLDRDETRRIWIVSPDDRLRESHAAVPIRNPDGVGLDEPFQTPVGPAMGPGQSGVASFDVNCRCTTALDFLDEE